MSVFSFYNFGLLQGVNKNFPLDRLKISLLCKVLRFFIFVFFYLKLGLNHVVEILEHLSGFKFSLMILCVYDY